MENVKKNDFVEIKYTGFTEDGKPFDSNIEEDLKVIDPKAKAEKTIIVIGQTMVVSGLDKALEGKEIGKEYSINLKAKEAFGERNKNLMKTIPLKVFREQKVDPRPGMVFVLDNNLARIVAVSGARVVTDFNNPLAGKDVSYKFTIVRKVEDEKEKVETLFMKLIRFVPEFEIKDSIIIKGRKELEFIANAFNDKFKTLVGKEIKVEIVENKEVKDDKSSKEESQ